MKNTLLIFIFAIVIATAPFLVSWAINAHSTPVLVGLLVFFCGLLAVLINKFYSKMFKEDNEI